MSWAEIKKAVNSNLAVPLNELIVSMLEHQNVLTMITDYKTYGEDSYVAMSDDYMNKVLLSREALLDKSLNLASGKAHIEAGFTPEAIMEKMGIFASASFKDSVFDTADNDIWTTNYKDLCDYIIQNCYTVKTYTYSGGTASATSTKLSNVYLVSAYNGRTQGSSGFATRNIYVDDVCVVSSYTASTAQSVTPKEYTKNALVNNVYLKVGDYSTTYTGANHTSGWIKYVDFEE